MQVVLLHDVPKVGRKYEVKKVPDGYANNFLIPRKMAEYATKKAVERAKRTLARRVGEQEMQSALLGESIKKLGDKTISIRARANEQGSLFAGIGAVELAAAIKEQLRIDLNPTCIQLEKPVKEVGETNVLIVAGGRSITVPVTVVAEK